MESHKKLLSGAIFIAIIGITLLVMGQVGPPSTFYGGVYIDGNPAPVGTHIQAEVDSITTNYYVEVEGIYGIAVEGLPGGGSEGHTIQFTVNGMDAGTGIFSTLTQGKDLSVGTANECATYTCQHSGWVSKDISHSGCGGNPEGCVCKDSTDAYYDKACCGGEVHGISTYKF